MDSCRFVTTDIIIRAEGAFSMQNNSWVGYCGAYAHLQSRRSVGRPSAPFML